MIFLSCRFISEFLSVELAVCGSVARDNCVVEFQPANPHGSRPVPAQRGVYVKKTSVCVCVADICICAVIVYVHVHLLGLLLRRPLGDRRRQVREGPLHIVSVHVHLLGLLFRKPLGDRSRQVRVGHILLTPFISAASYEGAVRLPRKA